MRRSVPKQDLENGQDSFLDVVSNIVGILIVLVVVVGAQVKTGLKTDKMQKIAQAQQEQNQCAQTPDSDIKLDTDSVTDFELQSELNALVAEVNDETTPENVELSEELTQAEKALTETVAQERRLEEEIAQFRLQKQRLDAENEVFATEIIQLDTRLRLIQTELQNRTSEKNKKDHELLQLSQESVRMEHRLEELRAKIKTMLNQQEANGGPKTIEHKTTPIVRTVESRELHFIVDKGYVMYVPLDELIHLYEKRIPGMGSTLLQRGEITEVLGPYDGFRLHTETRLVNGRIDVYWQLISPDIETTGERNEDALQAESKFQHHIGKLDAQNDILTFWIYPDGFASFSQLKEELYKRGFSIASRPLPEGTPIAGSPQGQRSVAQ